MPTFGTDTYTNERDFWDEEDPYFKSLVDNFVTAVDDVCKPASLEEDIDYKVLHQRKSALYAKSALMHYNNNEKHKVKFMVCMFSSDVTFLQPSLAVASPCFQI